MHVEQLAERELGEETEIPGENWTQGNFVFSFLFG
jgi:hypothetical protein